MTDDNTTQGWQDPVLAAIQRVDPMLNALEKLTQGTVDGTNDADLDAFQVLSGTINAIMSVAQIERGVQLDNAQRFMQEHMARRRESKLVQAQIDPSSITTPPSLGG